MSIKPEPTNAVDLAEQPEDGESTTRRAMLRAGAAAAGAAAVGVVAASAATPAQAAPGDVMRVGRTNRSEGASTGVWSTSDSPTMVVRNIGASGAGALVTSTSSNGLAAGTSSHNAAGLSVANYSSRQGRGAAVWAVGGANNGIVATSGNIQRAAVAASNTNDDNVVGIGAAIVAKAEAGAAVVATSTRSHEPAVLAYKYDENGEITDYSIQAIGGVYVLGTLMVEGDLYVSGTIYCDNVEPYPPHLRAEHAEAGEGIKARAQEQAAFADEVTKGG